MDVVRFLADQFAMSWFLGWNALRFSPDVTIVLAPETSWVPLILIAVGAAAATLVGQSVVLLANRIRRWALVISLLFATIGILATHAVEGLLLWGLGQLIFPEPWTALEITKVVVLSSAPLVFGFLTAIPLLGPAINRLLSVWSLLVLWAIVAATFQVGFWAAAGLVLVAWLGTLLVGNLLGPLLASTRDRIWRRVTGRPLHLDTTFLLEMVTSAEKDRP
ncbi:hypothetical protein AADG42_06650 [Ammonicoccus fulvus]|uniref:Uncharacterized protein n=1 Tax=Ammonicoccus fulvus TaxID=3138240 RepID=A0ABZ3FMS2_9ACTN